MTQRHYVVVRQDLPLGVLCAQVVHAAGESSDRVPTGTHAVVLSVPDEAALASVAGRLRLRASLTTPSVSLTGPTTAPSWPSASSRWSPPPTCGGCCGAFRF